MIANHQTIGMEKPEPQIGDYVAKTIMQPAQAATIH
jgi:hypothetical protein